MFVEQKSQSPFEPQAKLNSFFKDSLGVSHLIWLGEGIVGDDTDGHIDDIARFVDPMTVVCVLSKQTLRTTNYRFLRENYERLQSATDQDGHILSVVTLPCPAPVDYEGSRLPASYANFYIANEVVLGSGIR